MRLKAFVHSSNNPKDMKPEPESINQWFPSEQQDKYISRLIEQGQGHITRCQAKCYVRLRAYLLVKQQQKLGKEVKLPLKELSLPEGFVSCTHREAAALFYCDQNQGSDRSAGMMLNKLCEFELIEKQFDGNTINIQVQYLPNLTAPPQPVESVKLKVDAFRHNDAIPVANFLSRLYRWINNDTAAVEYKIVKLLRGWVKQYPTGMRVLRRCDNSNPVGFYVLYPTAPESERNFFLPPSKALHLCSDSDIDPFQIAIPGKDDCTCVFFRGWRIDTPYLNRDNVRRFVEDTQKTLVQMQADFPNLCDLYLMIVHPVHSYIQVAVALGFQKIGEDPNAPVYWMYISLDQFLSLDIKKTLSKLEFAPPLPDL